MNGTILNLGPLEIVTVLILALLVLGPERLPGLMRGLGQTLRRIREMYVSFVTEFRAELQPIAEEVDSVTREIQGELQAIREAADFRNVLQPVADDITKATDLSTSIDELNKINAPPAWRNSPANAAANAEAAAEAASNASAATDDDGVFPLESADMGSPADAAAAAVAALYEPAIMPEPVIAPPAITEAAATNGHAETETRSTPEKIDLSAALPGYRPPPAGFGRAPINLSIDNPWWLIEPLIRSDQLDEDSPWRGN
jgi:sec-independent protein translocase protein TatB